MNRGTYGGLLNGGEDTSRLNHILGSSVSPLDVGWVSPAAQKIDNTPMNLDLGSKLVERMNLALCLCLCVCVCVMHSHRETYSLKTVILCPSITSFPPSALTSPWKRPCVESYLNMYTWADGKSSHI